LISLTLGSTRIVADSEITTNRAYRQNRHGTVPETPWKLRTEKHPCRHSTPQVGQPAVEQREWKNDPAVYRVFKSFLRGAFEGALPPTDRLELLDARRIAAVSELAVNRALSDGPCLIVGLGSQYFLRNRKDVFRTFLYASRTSKIHRLITAGYPKKRH
jgi:hypothetical protein